MVADEIWPHKEAHMIFTTVFPGLKKEWHPILAQIGSLLGTIIAMKDVASQEDDPLRGAPTVRILALRNAIKSIIYQGLSVQCFLCRHFGHLGKDCTQKLYPSEEASKSTFKAGRSDWTPIAAKDTLNRFV